MCGPANGFLPEEYEAMKFIASLVHQNPNITADELLTTARAKYAEWRDLPYGKSQRRISDSEWDRLQDEYLEEQIEYAMACPEYIAEWFQEVAKAA